MKDKAILVIDDVIKEFKEKYEYALKQKYIHKPMSYALYQTWKKIDKTEKKNESNTNT